MPVSASTKVATVTLPSATDTHTSTTYFLPEDCHGKLQSILTIGPPAHAVRRLPLLRLQLCRVGAERRNGSVHHPEFSSLTGADGLHGLGADSGRRIYALSAWRALAVHRAQERCHRGDVCHRHRAGVRFSLR